jgi:hypothetical protein
MDIPNWRLNASDRITQKSSEVDIQAVNSQPAVQEASEQMKSPWGSQSVRRKTTWAENSESIDFLGHRERFGKSNRQPRG